MDTGNYEVGEHMGDLFLTRAKPNPLGKDRFMHRAPNILLNEEWVEFVNLRDVPLNLGGVSVWHETYDGLYRTGEQEIAIFVQGVVLQPGWTLRLHTGCGTPYNEGVVHHSYLDRENYVWNNDAGDRATLRDWKGEVIDSAWYAPFPPEGVILLRRIAA
jgi:hypothetical protein